MTTNKPSRPRNIAADIVDAVETATRKWTRQKKSEERHPGMIRYRSSRMTKEPRTTQKEAAWQIMEDAYMAASGNNTLPALARQIFYQARPKIMAMTDERSSNTDIFLKLCCPIISKSTVCIGMWSMTPAVILKNRTPTGAAAAGRLKSVTICTR
jgi:hypothetical protein